MEFQQPFLKLPLRFDAETLESEVRVLPSQSWVPHPTGFPGNDAVRLVTVDGEATDAFYGPMRPTGDLERCPYIQQVMAKLGGVWSRSRLMGLGPGAKVPQHIDSHYHWRTHVRIHIPTITNPKVQFTCDRKTIHMAAGECWLFDSFRFHRVENGGPERRVHLVLDTVMTDSLHDFIDTAQSSAAETEFVAPGARPAEALKFEQLNKSPIMSPWEIRHHLAFILAHSTKHPKLPAVRNRLERFADSWAANWAQFGPSDEGLATYRRLLVECRADVLGMANDAALTNSVMMRVVLDALIFGIAAPPDPAGAEVKAPAQRQRLAS